MFGYYEDLGLLLMVVGSFSIATLVFTLLRDTIFKIINYPANNKYRLFYVEGIGWLAREL